MMKMMTIHKKMCEMKKERFFVCRKLIFLHVTRRAARQRIDEHSMLTLRRPGDVQEESRCLYLAE
jgi:hypothetical protein